MAEGEEYRWFGVLMLMGIMLFLLFIYVKNNLERSRTVIFERDEAGRITAIHYT